MSLMHSGSPSHATANSDSNNLHPSIPSNDVNIPTLLAGALMPVLVYAIFGSSRELSVGPVAVTSLLTAAALKDILPEAQGIENPNMPPPHLVRCCCCCCCCVVAINLRLLDHVATLLLTSAAVTTFAAIAASASATAAAAA